MELVNCKVCLGTGEVWETRAVVDWENGGYLEEVSAVCDVCDGSGEEEPHLIICEECHELYCTKCEEHYDLCPCLQDDDA